VNDKEELVVYDVALLKAFVDWKLSPDGKENGR
jgi:hypothetical protein